MTGSTAESSPAGGTTAYSKRVIVKYENRRLYDSQLCRYVTEKDVRELVMKGVPFVIRERKTDADLSRAVLLRVLAADEGEEPLLTVEVIAKLIRCTDATLRRQINAEFSNVLSRVAASHPT